MPLSTRQIAMARRLPITLEKFAELIPLMLDIETFVNPDNEDEHADLVTTIRLSGCPSSNELSNMVVTFDKELDAFTNKEHHNVEDLKILMGITSDLRSLLEKWVIELDDLP
jgi:hypothetical protein